MKRYKYIVWDWNGTLMDDLCLCLDIVNGMLLRRGLDVVDRVRYREVFGFPLRDYCIRIGFDLKRDPFERLSDEFNNMYEMRRCECPLQEGVVDRLGELKNVGIQHTLLSAYGQERLLEIVEFHGLSSLFCAVWGLDNSYGEGKVERGQRCMAEIDWQPSEILYVGDTLHDGEVAKAMGIDCVLVSYGHQNRQLLSQGGYPIVDSLDEVRSYAVSDV